MNQTESVGKALLKMYAPVEYHEYISNTVLDKKGITELFDRMQATHKDHYNKVATELARLGFEIQTRNGSSLGLEDLVCPIDKEKAFKELEPKLKAIQADKAKTPGQINDAIFDTYADFFKKIDKEILDKGLAEGKSLAQIIRAGSRGSPQQYRSTVATQGIVMDKHGKPMLDFPIKSSYQEGLSLPEYLVTTFGARQGEVAKKLSVQDAGYQSKQVARASITTQVAEHDCGTDAGVPFNTSDMESVGSYTAKVVAGHPKNTLVTPSLLRELHNKKIETVILRSPMTCKASTHHHFGAVCQLCVGQRENGLPRVGDYTGLLAQTAMGEPLQQGAMNVRHGGGAATKANVQGGFKVIQQLFNIPDQFQNRQPLAEASGVVKSVTPAQSGGTFIDVGGKVHHAHTGFQSMVKPGDHVEQGDQLAEGLVNPQDVVRHKGIGEGRRFFANQLSQVYQNSGMPVARRNFELFAKGQIDHVRITHPEGLGEHLPGAITSYSHIEKHYEPRKGAKRVSPDKAVGMFLEEPALHLTIGTRITQKLADELKTHGIKEVLQHETHQPFEPVMIRLLDVPEHVPDWAHQLYSTYLERRLVGAVNSGMTASLDGPSPILGLAHADGFGLKHP